MTEHKTTILQSGHAYTAACSCGWHGDPWAVWVGNGYAPSSSHYEAHLDAARHINDIEKKEK